MAFAGHIDIFEVYTAGKLGPDSADWDGRAVLSQETGLGKAWKPLC